MSTVEPINVTRVYAILALIVAGVFFYLAFGNSYIYAFGFVFLLDALTTYLLSKGTIALAIVLSSFVIYWTMGMDLGSLWFVVGLLFTISAYYEDLNTKSIFGKD